MVSEIYCLEVLLLMILTSLVTARLFYVYKFSKVESLKQQLLEEKESLEEKVYFLEQIAYLVRHDLVGGMDYISYGLHTLCKILTAEQMEILKITDSIKLIKGGYEQSNDLMVGITDWTNITSKKYLDNKIKLNLKKGLDDFLSKKQLLGKCIIDDSLNINIKANKLIFTALYNLITNGIKYNDKDNKLVKLYMEGSFLVIEDNGKGFDVSKLDNYFKPFKLERVNQKGFGLGLSIFKKICELHDLDIKAESELTTGTKFYIDLSAIKL